MERFDHELAKELYRPDLIKREINRNGLPKTALNILAECDRLINHYVSAGNSVYTLPLYAKKYRQLAEALKKNNQDINECVYRGFAFRNIEARS